MPPSPSSKAIALLNVAAGEAMRESKRLRETVLAAFTQAGLAAEVECLSGGELMDAAKAAFESALENDAIVVAAGGDGTIRTIASLLAGTRVRMGIIPLGTFNHFAKDLGIPLDIEGAVAVIASDHIIDVDVAEVNGRVFVNNSSVGVYPYMVVDRERRRRRMGIQRGFAMVLAGLRMLRIFPLRRLTIRVQGSGERWRTPCLFVGNNKYSFNFTAVKKREKLDDGALWLYIVKQQTRLGLLWLTLRSLVGLGHPERDVRVFAATEAEILSRRKRLKVATDGEVTAMRPPLHYRIRPRALRVYVPQSHPEP
jgi:YegS/Rv2252/BmrU family lipid kinase